MIEVEDLRKEYFDSDPPTIALENVSFSIKKGEFVSIMGPSGSGKSTLLHILSFLDRPTGGSYRFLGKNMDEMSDKELAHVRNSGMGFVFQAFNLLLRLSVYENVEIPLLYSGVSHGERRARIEEAVASVGLSEKLDTATGKLSGGQKQRIAIARALVTDPSVIFADEPTGNLDSKSGSQVMEILDDLNVRGRTIVLVTHETNTAEFAHRIIRVKDGTVENDTLVGKRRHAKDGSLK
ncbi:ABC transporter ATP-binding protein [Candidatus Kaiserbacteria bacterium]|nr:ABC transporter ATP-binding protein [Candidatus Kaiserbacteria bacterium]